MKNFGHNIQTIANDVPGTKGGSVIENYIGEFLNKLSDWTGGIMPSENSYGGLIAQIPVLLGDRDINHQIMEISATKKDGYVKLSELQGYDPESPSAYDNVYVKVHNTITQNSDGSYTTNRVVTSDNATFQNGINGMLNSPYLAIKNGLTQTGMVTNLNDGPYTFNSQNMMQNYNTTHGVVNDLLESAADKLFGTYFQTGIARQTGDYIYDVAAARGNNGANFAMHSQGNLISNAGIRYIGTDRFASLSTGRTEDKIPTFASFGSPESYNTFNTTLREASLNYSGTLTHDGDAVGEVLGGNYGSEGKRPIVSRLLDPINPMTYYNAVRLFTSSSPHATYYCSEASALNSESRIVCGGN